MPAIVFMFAGMARSYKESIGAVSIDSSQTIAAQIRDHPGVH